MTSCYDLNIRLIKDRGQPRSSRFHHHVAKQILCSSVWVRRQNTKQTLACYKMNVSSPEMQHFIQRKMGNIKWNFSLFNTVTLVYIFTEFVNHHQIFITFYHFSYTVAIHTNKYSRIGSFQRFIYSNSLNESDIFKMFDYISSVLNKSNLYF